MASISLTAETASTSNGDALVVGVPYQNNATHSSTKTSPFFANMGYHPKFSVTIPRVTKDNTPLVERVQALQDLHSEMKFNIQTAVEGHAQHFDTKVMPQPDFQIGERVWLDTRNLRTIRPAKKLDYKRAGPYKILEKVGTRSYRLDLPKTMKIHPVFHVSLLERPRSDPIPGRVPQPPQKKRGLARARAAQHP